MNADLVKNAFYLYAEDDPFSRELMVLIADIVLGAQHLTIFENSLDFMARLKALPHIPDVIMLDIHMKPHSGFEVLEMIRKDPVYKHTRIIALTASVMNEEIERLQTGGFDGAIGKPFELALFASLMEKVLKGQQVWHIT